MTRLVLTVLLLLAAASSVRAQQSTPPRLELAATISGIAPILAEGPYIVFGVGPRLTVNASRWLGLELGIEKISPSESSRINALYTTQLKIPLRRTATKTLSLTAGAAGLVSFQHRSEVRITRPDQSIVVHPSFDRVRVEPPNMPMVGIAQDVVTHRHAAVSFSAQAMFGEAAGLAVRGAVGITFGLGSYR